MNTFNLSTQSTSQLQSISHPNIHTMDHFEKELKKEFQLERMILFSDAVFAIAITILILEIKVPELHENVSDDLILQELGKLVPKFIGFFISFFLTNNMCLNDYEFYVWN